MREVKLVYLLGLVSKKGKKGQERVWADRPLDDLTPAFAQKCYSKLVESGMAAATHHAMLVAGKGFGQWLAQSGARKENVFAGVRAEGVPNKRKDRLKLDDARKLIAACYEDPHPLGGLAVASMLTLGTRSHELLERVVMDLDQSGTVLVIFKSKSKAGERRVTLPPVLRAKLRQLTQEQPNGSLIFRGMTNNTLLNHVERLCEVAGVKVITAHGLRDTWSDLTMDVLARMDKTARGMGHADSRVTAEHYLSAGTEQSARAAMMEDLLLSTETQQGETEDEMIEREMREAEEKLAALKARKAGGQTAQVSTSRGPATETAVPTLKLVP
jgi:integrase